MKYLMKFYTIITLLILFSFKSFASEKIKIGLVVPLSGENKELGESILKSVRLAVNDIDDRLQREYWRHIKFFDTNKELQIFSKSIKHNYETVYNLKSILLHEYGNMYKINNLANNIFYGCFHDDYIDFVNVFRHIHFDKFDN